MKAVLLALGQLLELLFWVALLFLFLGAYRDHVLHDPFPHTLVARHSLVAQTVSTLILFAVHPSAWAYGLAVLGLSRLRPELPFWRRLPYVLLALAAGTWASREVRKLLLPEVTEPFWALFWTCAAGGMVFWLLGRLLLPHVAVEPEAPRVLAGTQATTYVEIKRRLQQRWRRSPRSRR